jgi:hypothetical protein
VCLEEVSAGPAAVLVPQDHRAADRGRDLGAVPDVQRQAGSGQPGAELPGAQEAGQPASTSGSSSNTSTTPADITRGAGRVLDGRTTGRSVKEPHHPNGPWFYGPSQALPPFRPAGFGARRPARRTGRRGVTRSIGWRLLAARLGRVPYLDGQRAVAVRPLTRGWRLADDQAPIAADSRHAGSWLAESSPTATSLGTVWPELITASMVMAVPGACTPNFRR